MVMTCTVYNFNAVDLRYKWSLSGMYEVGVDKAIMFKIKWKGSKTLDLVTVEEAKEKCPQLVIEFYEQRISWL